jgi:hypothetical protein
MISFILLLIILAHHNIRNLLKSIEKVNQIAHHGVQGESLGIASAALQLLARLLIVLGEGMFWVATQLLATLGNLDQSFVGFLDRIDNHFGVVAQGLQALECEQSCDGDLKSKDIS